MLRRNEAEVGMGGHFGLIDLHGVISSCEERYLSRKPTNVYLIILYIAQR